MKPKHHPIRSFEEIHVGLSAAFDVSISKEMLPLFRSLSGDTNPLHTDKAFAREKGFEDVVVYGLLVSSFYSRLSGVYLPGDNCLLHGIDVSFNAPVFVGDSLRVSGEVKYVNEAFRQIEIGARIVNQHGNTVSKAKIRAGYHE